MPSDSSHDRTIRTTAASSPGDSPPSSSPTTTQAAPGSGGSTTSPTSPSRASVPPSEPRSTSRASFSQLDISADHPARLQMIVALVLGLVLVAIPLYLWRRPRAESIAVARAGDGGADPNASGAPPPTAPPDDGKPTLSAAKNVVCQDPGPRKTPVDQCDHLLDVEKALAKAIEDTASCVPRDSAGGTIQFVADVSFKRKSVNVATPKDGRTIKTAKIASACQSAVKGKLHGFPLETLTHAHARYKIAITATYGAGPK